MLEETDINVNENMQLILCLYGRYTNHEDKLCRELLTCYYVTRAFSALTNRKLIFFLASTAFRILQAFHLRESGKLEIVILLSRPVVQNDMTHAQNKNKLFHNCLKSR